MPKPVWHSKALTLIGKPVGMSMADGTGVSGILCNVEKEQVVIMQYLYHSQFASKRYPFQSVRDIYPFPGCTPPASQAR
ncbi:hypothetical protein ACFSL6_12680 [Paenibacillus thailandensis]|uniref:Uncharacterized protein n=1 Tax=Paenibacillus thailandensis TaxID=393250 RepID=A0ABW5R2W6_9BACL